MVAEGNATEPLLKQALLAALQSLFLLVNRLVHLHERGAKLPAGGPFTAEKLHIMVQKRESSEQIGELLSEFDRPQGTLSTVQHEPLILRCALVFGLAFQPILYTVALGSIMSQDLVYLAQTVEACFLGFHVSGAFDCRPDHLKLGQHTEAATLGGCSG